MDRCKKDSTRKDQRLPSCPKATPLLGDTRGLAACPPNKPQSGLTPNPQDMAALNCLDPHLEPRATAFVPHMISTISRIIDNGHAYAVEGGDVFFDVASLPGYGRLSGRAQEDNRCAGMRLLTSLNGSGADVDRSS